MKTVVFSIYDSKTAAYAMPFFSQNRETGQRAFRAAVQETNSYLWKFPEDYTLFELGVFDDATGVISMHQNLVNLGQATNYKGQ